MIETCDIAIIGMGPAGSSAARAAANAGARVLAFDRKKTPGLPVQCAEFVPMMLGVDSGPVDLSLVQQIDAMENFIELEPDRRNVDFRGRMIDRAKFDRLMVSQAEEVGVEIHFAVEVIEIISNGTITFSNGRQIAARVTIGADGPRSRLGAAVGAVNRQIVETRQATVPLHLPQTSTDIFLSTRIPGGYAWLFPKGNVANVGIGVDRNYRDRLKIELESLLDFLAKAGKIGRRPIAHTGGSIPVGGPVGAAHKLGDMQVLLAGDAAGLTNPVTGAGIPAACHSGRMAGEAAARIVAGEPRAALEYCEEIDDLFGASLRRAGSRRRELLAHFAAGALTADQLRKGWIAYPDYWTAKEGRDGVTCNELLEA